MSKKLNWLIFIIFAVTSFLVGLAHEPWLDEAQSWLIARDCSFYDIMFTRCSYEGTPFLWFYILKIFILLGCSYEYIFVISWLFACLGVFLFLFKSNFSAIFKITIPFTFYIFYQYCIIARPYCLLFPALCFIAIYYNKRFEKPFLYCGLLAILASIHAYGYVISLILMFFLIADGILEYLENPIKTHHPFTLLSKNFIPVIFLICYLIFVALISMKNPDCDYVQKNIFLDANIFEKMISALLRGYFNLTSAFAFVSAIVITLSLYYLSIKTFCKTKKQLMFFIVLNSSIYVSLVLVNFYDWHLGIILFTLLFCIWILKDINNITISFKKDGVLYSVCLIVIFMQISFSAKTSFYEFNEQYDGAKTVAQYLKQNNFTKNDIIAFGCRAITLQPYFAENIFMNKNTAYYHWSKKELYKEIERTENMLDKAKIFITDEDMIQAVLYKNITNYIYDNCGQGVIFDSNMYIKGIKFPSATKYYVFVRENVER